jgi:hypothetical protein
MDASENANMHHDCRDGRRTVRRDDGEPADTNALRRDDAKSASAPEKESRR